MPQLVPVPLLNDQRKMPDAWTPWCLLRDFDLRPYKESWGCYAFALKASPPGDAPVDPLDPDIVDIGETKGATTSLQGRVGDFRAVVLEGKRRSHAAAWTYLKEFPNSPPGDLYVALYPVWDGAHPSSKTFTMLLERVFIHNWVVVHGVLPACNKE